MSAFGSDHLRWAVRDGVGWLTIDRPEVKNSMSLEMYRGVGRAMSAADEDDAVGVVVITGVDRLFCVGGGMTADVLFEDPDAWPGMGYVPNADGSLRDVPDDEVAVDIEREILPFDAIRDARTTVISAVNGLCIGGGFIISLSSDISIASDDATFWIPELLRGVPDPWLPALLPAYLGLERAKYLMLTAQKFGSAKALDWGLVSEVLPRADLLARAEELAGLVLRGAPTARAVYKAQANRYLIGHDLDAVAAASSEAEKLEGFRSFAERRAPSWIPEARREELGRQ